MTILLNSMVLTQQQSTMELPVEPGYTNLRLVLQGSSSYAANDVQFGLRINGDGNGNYMWQSMLGTNVSAVVASNAGDTRSVLGRVPGSNALPNHSGFAEILIPNYTGTTFFQAFLSRWGESWNVTVGATAVGQNAGMYTGGLTTLNKVTFVLDNGLWIVGSQLLIYGE